LKLFQHNHYTIIADLSAPRKQFSAFIDEISLARMMMAEALSTRSVEMNGEMNEKEKVPDVNSKLTCGPYHSPAQLSDISTVAISDLDLEEDDWQSDLDDADPNTELSETFPTLDAWFDKQKEFSNKGSIQGNWGVIGEKFLSKLSSCEVDSDGEELENWSAVGQRMGSALLEPDSYEEDFPCSTPQAKKSLQAWSAVGQRMASTLSSCDADSDEEDFPSTGPEAKRSIEAWGAVGHNIFVALSSCDVDSDEEGCHSRMPQMRIEQEMNAWNLVADRLACVFTKAAEEEENFFSELKPEPKLAA
jgi:hypothetical protein